LARYVLCCSDALVYLSIRLNDRYAIMRKEWSIIVVPNTSKQGYNFKVTSKMLGTALLVMALVLLGGLVACTAYAYAWRNDAREQVGTLKSELNRRDSDLAALNGEFAKLVMLEDKLREIAGLKPRQPVVHGLSQGGQGGPKISGTILSDGDWYFLRDSLDGVEVMSTDDLLQAATAMQGGFSEILETLQKEEKRLSSVPSINPVFSPDAWISSGYGYREDPIHGKRRFHDGIDIVAPRKTPIIAPADGVVTFSGWRDGIGRAVEIRHGYGYRTTYGHNQKLMVKRGETVKRGDVIALLGNSGRSTGPHLHYEIRLNGKLLNPYKYVID